jgi:hypothetical protein
VNPSGKPLILTLEAEDIFWVTEIVEYSLLEEGVAFNMEFFGVVLSAIDFLITELVTEADTEEFDGVCFSLLPL